MWLALLFAAEFSIQPSFQPPSVPPVRSDYEVRQAKPIDWTCRMRTAQGRDFIAEGRFARPNVPKSYDLMLTRPLALRFLGGRQLVANGVVAMEWSSALPGRYWFEISTPEGNFKAEMDFIEPGKQGYLKLLSSKERIPVTGGSKTVWQPDALGFCTTKIATGNVVKK